MIADHALDSQWRYREAFWTACLEKGAIDDAQLVLAGRVQASARATPELGDAFARLDGAGVQGNHSVLLLRVGALVFCEWSQNGKLRAWPSDWKVAPRFDRRRYDRAELMESGLPFPPNPRFGKGGNVSGDGLSHIGSERGYWQGSVAELLARRVGLRLTETDWQPR